MKPHHDPHCIFCKIVRGEIPSARVIETDESIAFLDINPVIHGHTLLVPKAHYPSLADLPDALAGAVCSLLPRLARAVAAATGAAGSQRHREQRPRRRPDDRSLSLARHSALQRRPGQLALAAQRIRRRRARRDEVSHRARAERIADLSLVRDKLSVVRCTISQSLLTADELTWQST